MSLEADLSAPISERLIRLGYGPCAEAPSPNFARRIDLVGRTGSDLVVKPKRTLTPTQSTNRRSNNKQTPRRNLD